MSSPADLHLVCAYMDELLGIRQITDYPNAYNGLQLENGGSVSRIGAAVDASGFTLAAAAARGIDLLLVHHGLLWNALPRITGAGYCRLKGAFEANLAVYSAHLPLDCHSTLGNNVLLCQALGFGESAPFLDFKGTLIGRRATVTCSRDELTARLAAAVEGPVRVCPGGPEAVQEVGVITGGAGTEARAVSAEGIDTLITGEGPHWTHALAEELGLNLLYGGHYATETFGVRALAADVGARFGLPWEFIDHPSGL